MAEVDASSEGEKLNVSRAAGCGRILVAPKPLEVQMPFLDLELVEDASPMLMAAS